MRATSGRITPSFEPFDDVSEDESIIQPLRMSTTVVDIDTERSMATFEYVTGLAGRRTGRFTVGYRESADVDP